MVPGLNDLVYVMGVGQCAWSYSFHWSRFLGFKAIYPVCNWDGLGVYAIDSLLLCVPRGDVKPAAGMWTLYASPSAEPPTSVKRSLATFTSVGALSWIPTPYILALLRQVALEPCRNRRVHNGCVAMARRNGYGPGRNGGVPLSWPGE